MIRVNTHEGQLPFGLAFIAMFYFDLYYFFNLCIFHLFLFGILTSWLLFFHSLLLQHAKNEMEWNENQSLAIPQYK